MLVAAGSARYAPKELQSHDFLATAIPGTILRFTAGQEIHGEGENATYAYRVVSGVIRSFRVLNDGRRQVGAFHFPHQIFSMELGRTYGHSAEAVSDTCVLAMRISTIETLIKTDPLIARELLSLASESLLRAREQVMMLGRKTAIEKVASFLIELSRADPLEGDLCLPMSRYDIADYLGLTIETVSRAFANLQRSSAIDMPSARRVTVLDRDALWRMAGHA